MSTDIEKAKKRIDEAEALLKNAILALEEAEKVKKNPLFGEEGSSNQLSQISSKNYGGLCGTYYPHTTTKGHVGFIDEKSADLVAEAINTLLLLRTQEGVTSDDTGHNHFISSIGLITEYSSDCELSPKFETKGLADKATKKVGEVEIIRMFKILNGISVE